MIEGRQAHHRLARELVTVVRDHWLRESDIEPLITVAQVPDSVVIQAEGYNTESMVVNVTMTKRHTEQS